jgi:hypothetical protein
MSGRNRRSTVKSPILHPVVASVTPLFSSTDIQHMPQRFIKAAITLPIMILLDGGAN